MILRSPAKINLCLDILKRDVSGYHEIQTVFHEVKFLFDDVELKEIENGIDVQCDNPDIPIDHTNTAYKAAEVFKNHFHIDRGIKIKIKKKIPIFSGLGGGSSNAVAVLKGLNELWDIHAPQEELIKLSNQISMDAAFFFYNGTAFGVHFGEIITPLPPLPANIHFEIIDTGVKISSYDAYQWIDLSKCGKNLDKTKKLIEGLHEQNSQKILENIHNDFEPSIFEKYPQLQPFLTGSGGAVFSAGLSSK